MFQLGPLKSPGPNGYPAKFHQHMWGSIRPDVSVLVQKFLKTRSSLRKLNETFVIYIPKKSRPRKVNDSKRISLCNDIYRIISEVVFNKLKTLLNKIIGPTKVHLWEVELYLIIILFSIYNSFF